MKRETIPRSRTPSPGAPGRRSRRARADGAAEGREAVEAREDGAEEVVRGPHVTPVEEVVRGPRVTAVEEEDEGGGGRRWWLWLLAAALALAAIAALLWWLGLWPFGGAEEEERTGPGGGPVPVSTAAVGLEEIPVYYEYNGLTFASRRAEIRPRVSGAIEEVAYERGAAVAEGELLYRLDARPFEAALAQAEAERGSVEASLAFAEAQVARFSELAEDGFATGERYDQALARREELEGQLAAIEARIRSARLNRQYTEIRAPFPGRTGISRLYEGELASPGGQPLATIVQLDPIEVRFEIRDEELPRIRRAMLGDEPVRVVALFDDDAAYAEYGALAAIDNEIDTRTGTLTALARFPNPDELILPGRLMNLRLLLGRADAIVIPAAALTANLDRRIVYRVGPEGEAVGAPVEIGRAMGDRVVVVSGLRPGDRIVTSNLQSVRAGVTLEIASPELPAAPSPPEPDARAAAARGDEVARPAPLGPPPGGPPPPPQGGDLVVTPSVASGGGRALGEGPPLVGSRPSGAGVPADALGAGPVDAIPELGAGVGTGYDVPDVAPAEPTPPEPVPPPAPPSTR